MGVRARTWPCLPGVGCWLQSPDDAAAVAVTREYQLGTQFANGNSVGGKGTYFPGSQ